MEVTTTIADALLDDLDDLNDSDEEETPAGERTDNGTYDDDDIDGDYDNVQGDDTKPNYQSMASGRDSVGMDESKPRMSRAFLENRSLQKHLSKIQQRRKSSSTATITTTATSTTPTSQQVNSNCTKQRQEEDHQLVVQSNKYLASIAEELGRAHAALAIAYRPKFPELEELVPNYIQYKNAVRCIWNEMDLTKVNDPLNQILNSNQIITITVAGSTTSGRPLNEMELWIVDDAANYMDELLQVQNELMEFVEVSMESLAPSICALIGPATAAKLLGLAGGLAELTKIPACNLQVLGQVKQNSSSRAGLSAANTQQHVGILAECDLVQTLPKAYQKKALKVVAAKLALAARYDFVNVDTGRPRSAITGRKFRHELEEKFEKLQEPDKAPVLKALPKPDLSVKKRRGGKRMRRWKERFEETAMMKQANTRAFSSAQGEYGDDAMGITMGLLDTADSGGNIRKTTEKRKMRQANTKASRKRAAQMAQQNNHHSKDGLASSVVFSQSSSMELINPDAQKERVREANRKWFDDNAGFKSAIPRKDF